MDKYIGRLLDNRYEILEVIGTGGMAVVYKARCHRLNRLVAIKILKDDFMEDEEFRRRFHSESQAVAMLSHPNIISVYDVSTSITADYIVMELIDGITLKQYMEKKGILNWKETLHFAIQIAKALEHAHGRGIVHRDIKPHNVMVLKNGSVKVTDFGIARVMSQGNTLTKEALGSVHYISPEQAKGGRVDNRSDIYSLGVVMYEMMSGKPPYDGETPVAVAIQHINGGAVMPSTINPNIPGGLEQIIMRAMAHEPANRYASATEMLADLDAFRKDPAILFDYNIPPTDEVVNLTNSAAVEEEAAAVLAAAEGAEENADEPAEDSAEAQELSEVDEKAALAAEKARKKAQKRQQQQQKRQEQAQRAAVRRAIQEQYEAGEARRNKVTTIAIISCVLVMVMAISIILLMMFAQKSETQAVVPDFLGRVYEELNEKDYDFRIIRNEEFSDAVDAGKIISQEPPAGTLISLNGTVEVTVSKGPNPETEPVVEEPVTVTMLDFKNKDAYLAEQMLKALVANNKDLTLKYQFMYEYSDEVESGRVIKTEPAFGEALTKNMTMYVYMSQGKDPGTTIIMDNFVGKAQDITETTLRNYEMGLQIKVEKQYSEVIEKGLVCGTYPAKGATVRPNQEVIIYISDGREMFTVPNLMVQPYVNDFVNAKVYLENQGYNIDKLVKNEIYSDTVPAGTLMGQSVVAGTKYPVNDEIVLTVSLGPKPPVTMDYTIVFEGAAEEYLKLDCEFWIVNSEGEQVGDRVDIAAGTESYTITLTGNGVQSYTYYLHQKVELTDGDLSVDFDVNFEATEEVDPNAAGTNNGSGNPIA